MDGYLLLFFWTESLNIDETFSTLKIGQIMPNRGTYITIEWQAYPQIIGDALLLLLLSYIVVLLLAYGLSYHCYYVIELLLLFIWLVVSTLLKHISQLGWWNSQYIYIWKINNVPNHQPVIISFTTYTTYQLRYAWHHLMSDGALDVQGAAFSLQPRWRTTSGERYLGDTTCCRWTVEGTQPSRWVKFSHTGWGPPVIRWFINPIKYSYIYI
jgi:hypothetical protein